jgi:hypothetical protein
VTDEPSVGEGWGDPPPRPQRYDWESIATRLRRRPEKWYKVFERDRASLAVALRQGSIKAMRPSGGFEFRTSNGTRDERPRTCSLHARYVPEKDQSKQKKEQ